MFGALRLKLIHYAVVLISYQLSVEASQLQETYSM